MQHIVDGKGITDSVTLEPSPKHWVVSGKRSMISWKCSWKMSGAEESLGSLIKSRMTRKRGMIHGGSAGNNYGGGNGI